MTMVRVGARVSACDVAVATGDDALMLWFGQREPRQDGVGVVARHRIGLEIGAARHLEQALASLLADLQGAAAATPSGGDAT